jgi:leucyl-tRNA synthetase
MPEHRYDPHAIETRWQELWARERTWEVTNTEDAEDAEDDAALEEATYVLEMLPYPSGEPHIGHLKCYSLGDAIAHFHRRLGRRVLHPMGYDAFGLPPRTTRSGRACTRACRPPSRSRPSSSSSARGDLDRLVARVRHL